MAKVIGILRKSAIVLIRIYQLAVRPFLGNHCRFHPSCSNYSIHALEKHGFLYGSILSLKRIARCHPWRPGGYDPVPDNDRKIIN